MKGYKPRIADKLLAELLEACGLIEIKLGGNDNIEAAASTLKALSGKIDTSRMLNPSFLMVLIGVGKYAYRREDGVYVVPIGCLKP